MRIQLNKSYSVAIVVLLVQILGFLLIATHKALYGVSILFLPFLVVAGIKTIDNPKLIIYLLIIILASIPVHSTLFPIKVSTPLATMILLAGLALLLLTRYDMVYRSGYGRLTEDRLHILFMFYLFFSIMQSLGWGYQFKNIAGPAMISIWYIGYFIGRAFFSYEEDWPFIKWVLLIAVFLDFLEVAYQTPYLKYLNKKRLLFLQTYTLLIAFVIALNEIAFEARKWKLIFYNLVAVVSIVTIILLLNRSMWVILALSMLLLMVLWFYIAHISLKPIFTSLFLWLSGIVATIVVSISKFGFDFLFLLYKRISTFSNLAQDTSLKIRIEDTIRVVQMSGKSIIWGKGIGDVIWRNWRHSATFFIDNDYLVLLWHYGIIGTLLLFAFWLYTLNTVFEGLKTTGDKEKRIFFLTVLSVGILLLPNALTETVFTTRPHVMIMTLLMGMAVSMVRLSNEL